ncbi:MAG TPA: hypothetical protein VKV40_13485 [Ktedonobacteraceae bacterium]|nr:hypothetical protein [Ktedonobacteraceae bacterium]
MSTRVEDLPGKMTLREKVALLAGTNGRFTVPVERSGIPSHRPAKRGRLGLALCL